ncbi:hypothetical protein G5B30_16555 [Sphingobacterium sp. SGG-5]|uniref:hypothetical protein n=1 Tax=Sphingobacterium sp. SGG-5 TaxID=2710881 RepID=UPI0013ED5FB2|nr:hypothetical protein [Sphingobacterium sp. SGG-5]NGM63522.1 hypothetical protein [Sphingobacterium sp. SGG-5]
MIVAIITADKAQELEGTEYTKGVLFNPVQMTDGRWFISLVEAQYLTTADIIELIDYVPPVDEEI